jgi:hypothetical protein
VFESVVDSVALVVLTSGTQSATPTAEGRGEKVGLRGRSGEKVGGRSASALESSCCSTSGSSIGHR